MAKNEDADNFYWDEYRRLGKRFKGTPEELEELVTEEARPQSTRKRSNENERIKFTLDD